MGGAWYIKYTIDNSRGAFIIIYIVHAGGK